MNATKLAKQAEVKKINSKIADAKALVIAEYAGLTVKEMQQLRQELKAKGVETKVYKNRLFKIAVREKGYSDLETSLTGPNLYAFGMEDDISPAKIIANFAKKHEALKMKAGIYENKVVDAEVLAEIASLPSWEEALTKLAMSLLSPIQQLGVGLNMIVKEDKLAAPAA